MGSFEGKTPSVFASCHKDSKILRASGYESDSTLSWFFQIYKVFWYS